MTPKKKPARAANPERAAFLAAICTAPEDDTARLVFADWLDEHGEGDRAEFIRLGCEQARLEDGDARHRILEKRLAKLLDKHEKQWRQESPAWIWNGGTRYRRGFVGSVVVSANLWIKRGEKLVETVPLTRVRLENVRDRLPELMATNSLSRLSELSLGWNNLAGVFRVVAACPALANLRSLELNLARLGDDDMKALAASRHLGGLTSLNLDSNRISEAGAIALAKSRYLLRLVDLDLTENAIGDRGLRALAGSPVLATVKELGLHENGIGDAGAIALAASPHVRSLRCLTLGDNDIGDAGAIALANGSQLARLKKLYLHGNPIGEAGALALAASPVLGAIEGLAVDEERIGQKAAKALQRRFGKKVVCL